jgi:large subunit ribosomal protein L35
MPKMKTHKSTKKRIKVTAKGKVKRKRSGLRHLAGSKSAKRKRRLRKSVVQGGRPAENLLRLVGEA